MILIQCPKCNGEGVVPGNDTEQLTGHCLIVRAACDGDPVSQDDWCAAIRYLSQRGADAVLAELARQAPPIG